MRYLNKINYYHNNAITKWEEKRRRVIMRTGIAAKPNATVSRCIDLLHAQTSDSINSIILLEIIKIFIIMLHQFED